MLYAGTCTCAATGRGAIDKPVDAMLNVAYLVKV